MTQSPSPACSCQSESARFPIIAPVSGVASCFAEPILHKYFALGSGVETALALAQAVPFALVLRYLAARLDARNVATKQHKQ